MAPALMWVLIVLVLNSKKRIEENAGHLTSVDLTSSTEKSKIHIFIKKSIDRLKGTDKNLPQVAHTYAVINAKSDL